MPTFIYIPSAGSWTPDDIAGTDLRLWLKADAGVYDAETGGNLITADGTAVRRWEDQSGTLSSHPTAVATDAPTYETDTLDGKPVIKFTAAGMSRTATPIYASDPASIQFFVLFRSRDTAASVTSVFDIDNYEPQIAVTGSTTFRPFAQLSPMLGVTTETSRNTAAWNSSSETWQLVSLRLDFPNDALAIRRDGGTVSRTETPAFNANSYGTANKNVFVGCRNSRTTEVLKGDIAEIVVVTNDATDDLRDKVEGYLAHKWGLEGNLPSGHAYKNAAP